MGLFMNGFKRPKRVSDYYIPPFWGDGSDGILTGGTTYHAGIDFEKYSGFCIKQFKEINWAPDPASPETLTVDEPCRGLILFVNGDVNIGEYATISMAKRGSILPVNPSELIYLYGDSAQMRHIVNKLKTLKGGTGGNGGYGGIFSTGSRGMGGAGGMGRVCQGGLGAGGGGGVSSGYTGGDGGDVIYPEVIGQSGGPPNSTSTSGQDGWNGGAGGAAGQSYETTLFARAGGEMYGAGPGGGGWGSGGKNGGAGEHTGGFILIIARGFVTITGTLAVTGGDGGIGGSGSTASGGGGGGAGGGVIAVFAKGYIDTSSATKTLTGGAGGTGYQNGTAGGNGTYYEEQI